MSKQVVVNNSGVGVVGLLQVLFIALKLIGVIAWGWWWVFSPIWISTLAAILGIVVLGIIFYKAPEVFKKWVS